MTEHYFENIPYATWLEKTLHELIKLPVKAISITALTNNGEAYSNYHNTSMADKLVIAGIIQQDAMFDSMAANGIVEYAEEEDDANGEAEEQR